MIRRTTIEKKEFEEHLLQDEGTSEKGKKYSIIRLIRYLRIIQESVEEV